MPQAQANCLNPKHPLCQSHCRDVKVENGETGSWSLSLLQELPLSLLAPDLSDQAGAGVWGWGWGEGAWAQGRQLEVEARVKRGDEGRAEAT